MSKDKDEKAVVENVTTIISHKTLNMYHFSHDWFSSNIPYIERLVQPIIGSPLRMLEIGVFEGRSTVWWLENILIHTECCVDCVDPFHGMPHIQERFCQNVLTYFKNKVNLYIGPSHIVLRSPEITSRLYDIVYIDGCHRAMNTMEDAVLAFRLLKIYGIMIFDDYLGGSNNMYSTEHPHIAITGFMASYKPHLRIEHAGYQLIVTKINEP